MSFAKGAGLAAAEAADSRDYNENYSGETRLENGLGTDAPPRAPSRARRAARSRSAWSRVERKLCESGVKPGMPIHRVRRGWIELYLPRLPFLPARASTFAVLSALVATGTCVGRAFPRERSSTSFA